jgi:uncharacterized membrane protein (TIGR02234 family)
MSRGLPRALAGCALGGALVLIAQAVTWSRATVPRPTGGGQQVSVTGHDVASGLPAIGWALLALTLAMLASSGVVRRLVGLVVGFVGLSAVFTAVAARGRVNAALANAAFTTPAHPVHAGSGLWWLVAAIGGVLATVAGFAALWRGGRWGGLGARYEAPAAAGSEATGAGDEVTPRTAEPRADDSAAVWRALDRGEDPT